MKSLAEELFDEINELNGEFAVSAIRDLNESNPLKTGLSRSNWTLSFSGNTEVTFPIDSPSDTVVNAKLFANTGNLLKRFFITNNIEYIVPLAEGSSPQASRGWVDRSLVNAATMTYGI